MSWDILLKVDEKEIGPILVRMAKRSFEDAKDLNEAADLAIKVDDQTLISMLQRVSMMKQELDKVMLDMLQFLQRREGER